MKRKQLAAAVVALSLGGLYLWHARDGAKAFAAPPEPPRPTPVKTTASEPPLAEEHPTSAKAEPAPEAPQKVEESQPTRNVLPPAAPKVDLVFALDTTSSMTGMI